MGQHWCIRRGMNHWYLLEHMINSDHSRERGPAALGPGSLALIEQNSQHILCSRCCRTRCTPEFSSQLHGTCCYPHSQERTERRRDVTHQLTQCARSQGFRPEYGLRCPSSLAKKRDFNPFGESVPFVHLVKVNGAKSFHCVDPWLERTKGHPGQ